MFKRVPASCSALIGSACLIAAAMLSPAEAAARGADPVVFEFSTVGDTRGDAGTPSLTAAPGAPLFKQDSIWLENTKAFTRILRSVQAHRSDFLFVNGDLIMGYGDAVVPSPSDAATGLSVADVAGSDLMAFYRQYGFWRGLTANLMETGTYIVPVPGNHEIQWKHKVAGVTQKTAVVENENAWRANMGDLILDQSRLTTLFPDWAPAASNFAQYTVNAASPAPDPQITTDQSGLSYSFDFRNAHFVVINTDATGWDSHAPVKWLANDLAAAQLRGAKHIFVFGHKPAYTYDYSVNVPGSAPITGAGLDGVDDTATCGTASCVRDQFWALIEQYRATYFCGHEHTYNAQRPTLAAGGRSWQILVGGGGSAFDPPVTDTLPSDRYYSWATVQVHQSGEVDITAYGFSSAFGPTQVLQTISLDR